MKGQVRPVSQHYDATAESYHLQYDRELLHDTTRPYPANYFRLQMLLDSFAEKKVQRVIEVGVGEGTPLASLASMGIDVWGFDISEKMVQKSKDRMKELGLNSDQVFWGDIQNPATYSHAAEEGLFDGVVAMGVMPHVEDDHVVIENISSLLSEGGSVFVEFRNKLFSLFTLNRHTADFVLNDLLQGVSSEMKDMVAADLESRLRVDMPPQRTTVEGADAPGYDMILSKFHNPFEVTALFEEHGFQDVALHWYHYHPAMPYLEGNDPALFRDQAMRLERESSGWKGYFLCSAFVVEAVKGGAQKR